MGGPLRYSVDQVGSAQAAGRTSSTGYSSAARISLTRSNEICVSSKSSVTSCCGMLTLTSFTPAFGLRALVTVIAQWLHVISGMSKMTLLMGVFLSVCALVCLSALGAQRGANGR